MLSPVVLGVKQSKAEAWGWVDNPDLTWKEVVEKAGSGELHCDDQPLPLRTRASRSGRRQPPSPAAGMRSRQPMSTRLTTR